MTGVYRVFYDDQCELCQASVTWLRVLDRGNRVKCLPIDPDTLPEQLDLDDCLREIHVLTPDGDLAVGADGIATLARLFPVTWIAGVLASMVPFRWIANIAYRYVAANRYSLSRCRGGVCRSAKPDDVRRRSTMRAFWACRAAGLVIRSPVAVAFWVSRLLSNLNCYRRYFRRRVDLLNGKMSICLLGGPACDTVPIIFGEQFVMIVYDGVAIDPGSPKMRRSLVKHLKPLADSIQAIAATHHHEEHVGNLDWLARRLRVPLYLTPDTEQLVRNPRRLPWARRMVIGQPEPVRVDVIRLETSLATRGGTLEVIPTPGHCDDHVSLYDAEEKLLLAGDAYMGAYFATPNPDVDSLRWIDSLERMLKMDIEIMVEGHGHIHTLRRDIPDMPGLVIREHPATALKRRLQFFRWLREQITTGAREGLPIRAIEATCFPWGQRWAWESFVNDQVMRLLTGGHFSRSELVRSFDRSDSTVDPLPSVFQVRFRG